MNMISNFSAAVGLNLVNPVNPVSNLVRTSQECAKQRQSAGIDLAPPLSDTGIPSPVAAPTLTTGLFQT